MDVKQGEQRYHADVGPCEIFLLEGRVGFPVAVCKNLHGAPIGVYAVDSLDERGWSKPRKKKGWTSDELEKVIRLRRAGMSHREIAREVGCSRAAVGRKIIGVEAGDGTRPKPTVWLRDDDKKEIVHLVNKGWRYSVVANWIGCEDQTVIDTVRRARQKKRRRNQLQEARDKKKK